MSEIKDHITEVTEDLVAFLPSHVVAQKVIVQNPETTYIQNLNMTLISGF